MNPRNAAHRLVVGAAAAGIAAAPTAGVPPAASVAECTLAICAKFFPNRSRSTISNFSFLFIAPGRLFKLLCLILFPFSLSAVDGSVNEDEVGKASESESRVVMSFLDGRRRFLEAGAADLATLEAKMEDLMVRLSRLEVEKVVSEVGVWVKEDVGLDDFDLDLVVMGAWVLSV